MPQLATRFSSYPKSGKRHLNAVIPKEDFVTFLEDLRSIQSPSSYTRQLITEIEQVEEKVKEALHGSGTVFRRQG